MVVSARPTTTSSCYFDSSCLGLILYQEQQEHKQLHPIWAGEVLLGALSV